MSLNHAMVVAAALLVGLGGIGHVLAGAPALPSKTPLPGLGPSKDPPGRAAASAPSAPLAPAPVALPPVGAGTASVGVVDYGVAGDGGVDSYATSAFMGTVIFSNISANNSALSDPYDLGAQLNVNLELVGGTRVYDYWLQDVATLNTQTGRVNFLDNIWNFSSTGADLGESELVGNGSILGTGAASYYGDAAKASLPGNDVNVTTTARVALCVVEIDVSGVPYVEFSYQDGRGPESFDLVEFSFARGWTDLGLVVNGSALAPNSLYLDAEFVLAGPGNGEVTQLVPNGGSATMSLGFWNGANFQAVPDAYDYGADTSERIVNASAIVAQNGSLNGGGDEYPGAFVCDGVGTLGPLYSRDQLGTVELRVPAAFDPESFGFSYVEIDGAFVSSLGGPYPIGEETIVNFSLWPGSYTIAFFEGGENDWSRSLQMVPVRPLTTTMLQLGLAIAVRVDLNATGLPATLSWSFGLGGDVPAWSANVSGPNATVYLPNGTYRVSATTAAPGYIPPGIVSFYVAGLSQVIDLPFHEQNGSLRGEISPATARVTVDPGGFEMDGGELNLSLAPGNYSLEVSATGYVPFSTEIAVASSESSWANVSLSPLPRNTSATGPPGPGLAWDSATGLALLGVGAALGIAGSMVARSVAHARRRPPGRT